MIAVVSSSRAERLAFVTLCASRNWPVADFESVHAAVRQFNRFLPPVVVMRHKLADGYSDDVIPRIRQLPGGLEAKVIVLVDATLASSAEARQLHLGADCVQRDPVRSEILAAYIEKFLASRARRTTTVNAEANRVINLAGARLSLSDRMLSRGRRYSRLTPKEAELAESLVHHRGAVIRYEALYSEVLGRNFAGDTSNMRVLLGKLTNSFRRIGVNLRQWIEVIPKSGYRLINPPESPSDKAVPRAKHRGAGRSRPSPSGRRRPD